MSPRLIVRASEPRAKLFDKSGPPGRAANALADCDPRGTVAGSGRSGLEIDEGLTIGPSHPYRPGLPLPGTRTNPLPVVGARRRFRLNGRRPLGHNRRPTGAKTEPEKGQRAYDQARRE